MDLKLGSRVLNAILSLKNIACITGLLVIILLVFPCLKMYFILPSFLPDIFTGYLTFSPNRTLKMLITLLSALQSPSG